MSRRVFVAAALLLLAAGCLLQIFAGYYHEDKSGHAWGSDDAYITYRYASNLAHGRGLVFNPGERVEGFSNLLYLLLLVPAVWVAGTGRLYAVSAGLNLALAAASLLLLYRVARQRLGEFAAVALAMLFALSPQVWLAVGSGLETPLVLLVQLAVWFAAEKAAEGEGERRRAVAGLSVLAAVSVLARADGFLLPLLAAAYLGLRRKWRAAAAVAGSTLATFGLLTLGRLAYYGWPLPNTYYAKIAGPLGPRLHHGGLQLASAIVGTGLLVYALALAVTAFQDLKKGEGLPFPAVFAAGWLPYFVWIGGDVFYDRFLLFLFPMGSFQLLRLVVKSPRRRLTAVLVALVALLQLVELTTDERFEFRLHKYDRWVFLGRYLGRAYPGAVIAVDAAGKVPFFSGLTAIDMCGLTDAHIAHTAPAVVPKFYVGHVKHDLDYVLSRRPDLIVLWLEGGWLPRGDGREPPLAARSGYRLVYILNTLWDSHGRDLIDVRNVGADEVRELSAASYRYGVFERVTPDSRPDPRGAARTSAAPPRAAPASWPPPASAARRDEIDPHRLPQ